MTTDRGYHVAVDIDDANSFIYAITNCFKTVLETVAEQQLSIKEKLAQGAPVSASEVFAAKAEPADEVPFEETVQITKKDWDSLVNMATGYRNANESKPAWAADLAGSILSLNDKINK